MEKNVNGMFTIEAVLVMPVVLFTLISVIYMSFFLYDYCRIQGIADLILHKAALNLKHEADIETGKIDYENIGEQDVFYQVFGISDEKINHIKNLLAKQLSSGLLATQITDIEVSAGITKVAIKVEGEFQIPIKGVAKFFKDRSFKLEAEEKLHNPAKTVRISEVVLKAASQIKGLDKLKEKFESFLGKK